MNLSKYILILTLTVFITACTSNTIYKKPKDLIAKDQMVDLLVDMYLANAAKNVKTKKLERKINYMPLVYEKYGIDSTRFQTSNLYYMSLIDDYEAIYKRVDAQLRKMLDTTEASLKTIDSLKKVERKSKKKLPNKNKFNKEKILKTIAEEQK
ncbi:MAG TPA: DUF4296 domain-containing protein [Lutibacter sp.]|nr:DUF4296 domain-containing protein [Lutibacter sp.]